MKKIVTICLICIVSTANANWQPGDDYKMHYPQLPDTLGWDVAFDSMTLQRPLADDWQCSKTGVVSDIHLWLSWLGDDATYISSMHVAIYSDNPYDVYTNPFSTPGEILWEGLFYPVDMIYYGSGDQGFFSPFGGPPVANDHEDIYQINITDIQNPFVQEEGTIYWLAINLWWARTEDQEMPGWKTSENHFNDGAVYSMNGYWYQLVYPENDPPNRTGNLDLAFVITPEPTTICLLALGALSIIRKKK
ncbi:MAG: PEP-CTERM sorting domain-containing protein [Phycisphaerae bacterium]|jgi:hypothetical protein